MVESVRARTGWPCVRIQCLHQTAVSVSVCKTLLAYLSLKYLVFVLIETRRLVTYASSHPFACMFCRNSPSVLYIMGMICKVVSFLKSVKHNTSVCVSALSNPLSSFSREQLCFGHCKSAGIQNVEERV